MNVVAGKRTEDALDGVDILLTVTNSNVPTFDGELLRPGMHVTSVVSSNKGLHEGGFITRARREVDDATLRKADVVVCNNIDQEKLDRTAVLWSTCEQGVIPWEKVWDIGQVMSGEVPGRTSDKQISFFKQNAFWGVGDQVIGRLLYERAKEQGLGIKVDVDGFESRIDSRDE
jgi:alanine dehydrogenase